MTTMRTVFQKITILIGGLVLLASGCTSTSGRLPAGLSPQSMQLIRSIDEKPKNQYVGNIKGTAAILQQLQKDISEAEQKIKEITYKANPSDVGKVLKQVEQKKKTIKRLLNGIRGNHREMVRLEKKFGINDLPETQRLDLIVTLKGDIEQALAKEEAEAILALIRHHNVKWAIFYTLRGKFYTQSGSEEITQKNLQNLFIKLQQQLKNATSPLPRAERKAFEQETITHTTFAFKPSLRAKDTGLPRAILARR